MFDAKKLLDQFLGGNPADPNAKPMMSPDLLKGAAVGGLAGLLLGSKGGRKMMTSAAKVGGAAVLGGLAYRAWQNWQSQKNGGTPAEPQPMRDITPATPRLDDNRSLAVLRAMIAAAKADGHIDAAEQQRIFDKLDEAQLDAEAKAFVVDELRRPLDIEAVVAGGGSPESAAEIYAASLLAVDPDEPAEQAYLAMLAARLKLEPGLKASIEAEARKAVA